MPGTDVTGGPPGASGFSRDHLYRRDPNNAVGQVVYSRLIAYQPSTLSFIDLTADGSGNLNVGSAGGGGGAVTIADGADVAQGTTTDASSANTVVGILKAIKASLAATLTVGGNLGRTWTLSSGTDSVDTELPAAAALSDNVANPTAPMIGAGTMLWDSTLNAGVGGWSRAPGNVASGQKVQSAQLPAALGAGGGLKVDGSGTTLPVSLAAAVDVSDRAARLLGVVDKGKLWDGTNTAAVKAASVVAVATDPALVVQQAPQRADASTLAVTVTAAVNTAATLTLPAAAAGLFHYITSIEVVKLYSVVGVANGAGVIITSTNLPGNPAWTTEQLASAAGTAVKVVALTPSTPLKSLAAATATTIVAPVQLQTIWRINVTYYTAP